jgi:hypothetical protein
VRLKYVPSQLPRGFAGTEGRCPCRHTARLQSSLTPLPSRLGQRLIPQKFRDATEAYDVLSDPERRHERDIDLARSRTRPQVRPEPLIPEHPTHVRLPHSPFRVEDEIARVFQVLDDIFGQIDEPG